MIVTTSARRQDQLVPQAIQAAEDLQIRFIPRGRFSVEGLLEANQEQELLMVTKEGLKLFHHDKHDQQLGAPFFFHPSSAMFRLKRLVRGEHDPFIAATGLQSGMSILDATLGLASDAIVAAYVVGETGKVRGIESVSVLAYMVRQGLQQWFSEMEELEQAMKKVHVIQGDHRNVLRNLPDRSIDVVYFDPMFETSVSSSTGISGLKHFANYEPLPLETVAEAIRVARRRVVMKESSYSDRFAELGFQPLIRKYASHWFGVIDVTEH